MERRRFSPTMASEWQTAFVSQNATGVPCSLPSRITTKVLKTARLFLQDRDQMFKTIRLHDPRPRLSFLSLRVETKNLVSRITGFCDQSWVFSCRPKTCVVIHCALASCGAVHCNRFCLWVCVRVCGCLFVCGSDTTIGLIRSCVQ